MAEKRKKGTGSEHGNKHDDSHECSDSKKIKSSKNPCVHNCMESKGRLPGPRQIKSKFFEVYKGLDDYHIPIFRAVQAAISAERVFYPGCDKHLIASLVFPNVVYLDFYAAIAPYFTDPGLLEWVDQNKDYDGKAQIKFLYDNYENDFGEKPGSFDLMISASAGIVSKPCSKYIKKGGFFLVNDCHFDARQTFVDPSFKLHAVYDETMKGLDFSENGLEGYFKTNKGNMITPEQVQESIDLPKGRRSFKLVKETLFYLFKKIK